MLFCALCNREFNIIKTKHLLSHGITREEYIDKYGGLVSEETSMRLSAGNKRHVSNSRGKKFSDEARLHMSLADRGKPKSEEFKQNLRDYYANPENKEKKSQEMREYYETHEHKGKEVLFKYNQLRKEGKYPGGMLGKKHTEEWFEKTLPKILGLAGVRPNKIETKLLNILDNIWPNKWKYAGDGSVVIGRKNPDFINVNGIDLIELFGDYFHAGENPQEKISFFEKYGYNCFVIWEHAIKSGLAVEQLKTYFQEV